MILVHKGNFFLIESERREGGLEKDGSNKTLRFQKESCIFLPAGLGGCYVIGGCDLLKIRC